jgi:hypothetical protein
MDIDKSFTAAEAIIEAEQRSPALNSRNCLNCNTSLTGVYCAECGQKDIPPRQTFGELMVNFVSSFWSFESKFLQTGRFILLKPGRLAKDYNEGKRERYFHPARMYVFISFVFFLLISVLPDNENSTGGLNIASEDSNYNPDFDDYDKVIGNYKSFAQYDSAQKALPESARDGAIEYYFKKRIAKVNERYNNKGASFSKDFSENFFANVPRIFFVLLPVFALLLKLLYVRRDYFYSEHLVFSIYYYNFFFLAGSVYMLLNLIPVIENFTWLLGLWIVLYLLFSMKNMYKQSWRKTIFKYCTFVFFFSFCVLLGLATNAVLTFLFI